MVSRMISQLFKKLTFKKPAKGCKNKVDPAERVAYAMTMYLMDSETDFDEDFKSVPALISSDDEAFKAIKAEIDNKWSTDTGIADSFSNTVPRCWQSFKENPHYEGGNIICVAAAYTQFDPRDVYNTFDEFLPKGEEMLMHHDCYLLLLTMLKASKKKVKYYPRALFPSTIEHIMKALGEFMRTGDRDLLRHCAELAKSLKEVPPVEEKEGTSEAEANNTEDHSHEDHSHAYMLFRVVNLHHDDLVGKHCAICGHPILTEAANSQSI